MEKLKDAILQIVDGYSGGIKGLELMTKLVERFGSGVIKANTFAEDIEKVVQKIPELGFLKYEAKIGPDLSREKFFVYRKVGVACPCGKEG